MTYDSRIDTYKHIDRVRELVNEVVFDLIERARVHDASKLVSPEVETFDLISQKLKDSVYGSDEYKATLEENRSGIEHHQLNNDHHPEYHGESRVLGMNLIQLVEMMCDWKAAGERHADGGDLHRSVEIGMERHHFGPEVAQLLHNTADYLEGK